MRNLRKYSALLFVFVLSLLLGSCSRFHHMNDAVRIKIDSAHKYSLNPYSKEYRNGSTLRGTVLKISKTTVPDSCPITPNTTFITKTYAVFVDSLNSSKNQVEFIPIEDIVLIGTEGGLPRNRYDNQNLFENFNNPDGIRALRAVPIDSIFIESCERYCPCDPFSIKLPTIKPDCPTRNYGLLFAELRAGLAVYDDIYNADSLGRQSLIGEIAAGFRFGDDSEWGLGIAYSYGYKVFNNGTNEDLIRSVAVLHGRWQSSKPRFLGLCMKPFLYGQLGLAIDELSIDLLQFYFNKECQDRMTTYLPLLNVQLPISAGIGIGLDIPLNPSMDLSFDFGFRSITFGETVNLGGLVAPSGRNINMFVARAGITF